MQISPAARIYIAIMSFENCQKFDEILDKSRERESITGSDN